MQERLNSYTFSVYQWFSQRRLLCLPEYGEWVQEEREGTRFWVCRMVLKDGVSLVIHEVEGESMYAELYNKNERIDKMYFLC